LISLSHAFFLVQDEVMLLPIIIRNLRDKPGFPSGLSGLSGRIYAEEIRQGDGPDDAGITRIHDFSSFLLVDFRPKDDFQRFASGKAETFARADKKSKRYEKKHMMLF
jgi:hypothetical protein